MDKLKNFLLIIKKKKKTSRLARYKKSKQIINMLKLLKNK